MLLSKLCEVLLIFTKSCYRPHRIPVRKGLVHTLLGRTKLTGEKMMTLKLKRRHYGHLQDRAYSVLCWEENNSFRQNSTFKAVDYKKYLHVNKTKALLRSVKKIQ